MENIEYWIRKLSIYVLGMFLIAMGVSVSILSDLGVSPINSIPYVVSVITEIEMGYCVTAIFCIFILLQVLIMGRDFKMINILQIVCSTVFGMFVNITNACAGKLMQVSSNYVLSLVMLAISIVLIAFGVTMYLHADVMLMPGEGVMKAITTKVPIKMSTAKMGFDVFVVVVAIVISFVFLYGLIGVREGTIIAAFGVGAVMKVIEPFIKPLLNQFMKIA